LDSRGRYPARRLSTTAPALGEPIVPGSERAEINITTYGGGEQASARLHATPAA
jgi:hypothetical protein